MNETQALTAQALIRNSLNDKVAVLFCRSGVPMQHYIGSQYTHAWVDGVEVPLPVHRQPLSHHVWRFKYDFQPGQTELAAQSLKDAIPRRAALYLTHFLGVFPAPFVDGDPTLQLLTEGVILMAPRPV